MVPSGLLSMAAWVEIFASVSMLGMLGYAGLVFTRWVSRWLRGEDNGD